MNRLKILILGPILDSVRELIEKYADVDILEREEPVAEEVLKQRLSGKDAVVSEPIDTISSAVMDANPQLKLIANRAVGFDNVNIAEASKRNILVTNTPGVLDAATADLAMALLLATARRICEADRFIRRGEWAGFQNDLMLGPDLFGKTCGIIGMGRIGKAFAQRAKAFGMKLIYARLTAIDEIDEQLSLEFGAVRVDLDELLKTSDFISIHCPLNAQTRHLIGQRELNLMQPHCILINTARGAIIDEKALVPHLVNRKIYGAGLDVFEDEPNVPEELKSLDHVVLVPHIGSACFDTRRRMSEVAIESIISAFSGKRPPHIVNPQVWDQKRWNDIAREKLLETGAKK